MDEWDVRIQLLLRLTVALAKVCITTINPSWNITTGCLQNLDMVFLCNVRQRNAILGIFFFSFFPFIKLQTKNAYFSGHLSFGKTMGKQNWL